MCGEVLITRATQEPCVIYVLEDGTAFFSPDGEGRIWYESEEKAVAEEAHGGFPVVYLMHDEFDSEEI